MLIIIPINVPMHSYSNHVFLVELTLFLLCECAVQLKLYISVFVVARID